MKKPKIQLNFAYFAALAFLVAYCFFQFWYPYHLIRREQLGIFLYDWDYIRQTYVGLGWLAQFICDFLEQFFRLPVVGPVVIAALVTGIGFVTYKIFRKFLGKWPSLAIAFVMYAWSFFRETDNVYSTRYTLVVLGYLALLLGALSFKKVWIKPIAAVLFLGAGVWLFGTPVDQEFGRVFAHTDIKMDKVIGMDTEVYRENWDKVLKLSRDDAYLTEESYCYNLAHGMKGDLPQTLFNHPQNYAKSLLFWSSSSPFQVGVVGEGWLQLGDITLAEQCAIISVISTPIHIGSRFVLRLAHCNMITEDEGAAQKYLELLSKTLFYGKWARGVLEGNPDPKTAKWLQESRAKLASTDVVYDENEFRPILQGLLEANPSNTLARDYLLCYDLLRFELGRFAEDYEWLGMPDAPIYKEALVVWLIQQNKLNEETLAKYNLDDSIATRMQRFTRTPSAYKNTFWYYYFNAIED